MNTCDIGIYGLGIMGQNLALNLAGKGYTVNVYNRPDAGEEEVTATFIHSRCHGKNIIGARDIEPFILSLSAPRKILLMVKAGKSVDDVLGLLIPLLVPGDIIIDGGNSHYRDTAQRLARLEAHGLRYVGCGISGGADGALHGPSMMPGGSQGAWDQIREIFQATSAKSNDGTPCCDWIGPEGAGHFVKMVHNGIEYALMQSIAEAYDMMKRMLSLSADEMCRILTGWNKGLLQNYLLSITTEVIRTKDDEGRPLVDKILDCAGHKGTGRDAAIAAAELDIPATAIFEAISARCISGVHAKRQRIAKAYASQHLFSGDKESLLTALHDALICAQIMAYIQGFAVIARASIEYSWGIDLAQVARVWRGGCIIQSEILNMISGVLDVTTNELLLDSSISKLIEKHQHGWREAIIAAVNSGIPVPVLSSTLGYFDGIRSAQLPTNLTQAQRDYFGAHGFELRDHPRGSVFHSTWGRTAA